MAIKATTAGYTLLGLGGLVFIMLDTFARATFGPRSPFTRERMN